MVRRTSSEKHLRSVSRHIVVWDTANFMFWKQPPIIKIYEALGCISDERIHIESNSAKVFSSSGNKFYTVTYDPTKNAIMCNDNGSYWADYLGYPAIAFLLAKDIIPYSPSSANILKDIKWKDINQQFKNDFAKTEKYCQDLVVSRDGNLPALLTTIAQIYKHLKETPLSLLGPKIKPPSGY